MIKTFTLYIYISGLMQADSLFGKLLNDIANWREFIPVVSKFAEQLRVIFSNPRRYSREAVVVIAVVLISLLVLLLLALMVLALKKQYRIYRASRRVGKKISKEELKKRLIIAGSLLVFFVAAISIGASQATLCARCHEVKKSHTEWLKSAHKDAGCLSCHYEPGVFGYLGGTLGGAENLLAHIFKAEGVSRPIVTNGSCMRCHNDVFSRTVISKKEIKVQHKDLIAGGLVCISCHPDVAHQAKQIKVFAMNQCVNCHNNKVASAKCDTCHQQDIGYEPGQTAENLPKIKHVSLTCTGCHSVATTARCIECHGLELPHSEQFKQKHAMQAEPSQGRLCYKCHWERMTAKRMCGCHDSEGEIHGAPEQWYFEHRKVASVNGAACNCHGFSFCQRCHDDPTKVYPGGAGNSSGNQMHGGWRTGM